jgi:hypothetical protein
LITASKHARVVGVVQVVEAHHLAAGIQQQRRRARADEARGAGQQDARHA